MWKMCGSKKEQKKGRKIIKKKNPDLIKYKKGIKKQHNKAEGKHICQFCV